MLLEHLRLYKFRCYEQVEITPDPRFNVITGLNGQGKTSLLEAIGLLAFLRSFRNAKNAEMLHLGSQEGLVTGLVSHDDLSFRLDVKLGPHRKQATFNGKTCKYLSEYIGKVSAVTFSPNDLEIIRGSPENRRIWVDRLCQLSDPTHIDLVIRYQKILEHRNKQLKALSLGKINRLPDDFEVWTDELCQWGAKLIHKRIHSVDKSVDKIRKYYDRIAQEDASISLSYLSEIFEGIEPLPSGQEPQYLIELVGQILKDRLAASLKKDMVLGTTMVGPHRDDLAIRMGGNLVKAFGSQGEVRSLVLAMRLAEVEISKAALGHSPMVLIDDFSSELDARRRKFLLEYLLESDSQVFLSTTEELRLGKTWSVLNGYVADGCQQLQC